MAPLKFQNQALNKSDHYKASIFISWAVRTKHTKTPLSVLVQHAEKFWQGYVDTPYISSFAILQAAKKRGFKIRTTKGTVFLDCKQLQNTPPPAPFEINNAVECEK